MTDIRNERGFALPLTILVVTVMTMLIASAHVRARADRIIAESSGATVTAFAVAQSGLYRYLAYCDSIKVRPADGDSLRVNVSSG
jgi:Tfp pilus assembly protein PilX